MFLGTHTLRNAYICIFVKINCPKPGYTITTLEDIEFIF